jgi:2-dehydro-3-deoxyphosphogluconate aldolase / (4S)-4-hydroxy-2-oxoglutarate aldolase
MPAAEPRSAQKSTAKSGAVSVDQDWLQMLKTHRVIAVIRTQDVRLGLEMAQAIAAGGGRLIEVTWNSDHPAALVEALRAELPHCRIGCGTLLNQKDLREAIAAGVQFAFMPHVEVGMIHYGRDQGLAMNPGALTPTEVITAWNAGASAVKVFPVNAVGGADYIRSLQGPMGQIPLIPTGGVTIQNAKAFLDAGAIALGLSGDLFPKKIILREDWQMLTARMQCLIDSLNFR